MRVLPDTPLGIERALAALRDGGVVAHATETCYGLACDLRNPAAVARVFRIKRRPAEKHISALFPSVKAAKQYVRWNAAADELAARHLPGPLTLVLPLKANAPFPLYPTPAGAITVGVRVSPHPIALALVEGFGTPLSTTSANIHGQPNPYSVEDMEAQFGLADAPDILLDSGSLPPASPSTVVDLTDPSGRKILRAGELPQ